MYTDPHPRLLAPTNELQTSHLSDSSLLVLENSLRCYGSGPENGDRHMRTLSQTLKELEWMTEMKDFRKYMYIVKLKLHRS